MKVLASVIISAALACWPVSACAVAYRTGGPKFKDAWHAFYDLPDHEPEIDDPLIEAGRPIVPAICEAIRHKDMKYRRYAIGALGFIGDRRALPTLTGILEDRSEAGWLRGDALKSIYQIDRVLGQSFALKFRYDDQYLSTITEAVLKRQAWLLEPSEE
jgi:hypothetical protein